VALEGKGSQNGEFMSRISLLDCVSCNEAGTRDAPSKASARNGWF